MWIDIRTQCYKSSKECGCRWFRGRNLVNFLWNGQARTYGAYILRIGRTRQPCFFCDWLIFHAKCGRPKSVFIVSSIVLFFTSGHWHVVWNAREFMWISFFIVEFELKYFRVFFFFLYQEFNCFTFAYRIINVWYKKVNREGTDFWNYWKFTIFSSISIFKWIWILRVFKFVCSSKALLIHFNQHL